jgi:hypothetical protein
VKMRMTPRGDGTMARPVRTYPFQVELGETEYQALLKARSARNEASMPVGTRTSALKPRVVNIMARRRARS